MSVSDKSFKGVSFEHCRTSCQTPETPPLTVVETAQDSLKAERNLLENPGNLFQTLKTSRPDNELHSCHVLQAQLLKAAHQTFKHTYCEGEICQVRQN